MRRRALAEVADLDDAIVADARSIVLLEMAEEKEKAAKASEMAEEKEKAAKASGACGL